MEDRLRMNKFEEKQKKALIKTKKMLIYSIGKISKII